jgi:Tol biopolymer transport system component
VTLSAGTRIGPYEILSPLGAGGMGEVYRARDKKLDRDVAVKVLPQSVAADPDTLARFEREAKAIAALSHPNILAIHDFGHHDGVAFAVMEILEGQTLRERLHEGRLPARKAIDYAVQVANGLAAAHEKGIIHRDLKPENLFVTKDGRVKILDFGLAKIATPQSDQTHSPTAVAATEPGSVMGTVGYMSPEQVRGRPTDHRSDIFSFGSILYEMLSGKRAFHGDSAAETMAAIAQKDPPELDTSDLSLSPALDRIVRHCLEKNPGERFQSAGDLAFALLSAPGSSARHETIAHGASASLFTKVLRLAAAGAAIAVLAFALGWRLRKPPPAQAPPVRATFERLTDNPGVEGQPTLSPDGKSVAYVSAESGNDDVYLLRIGGRNPINLTADSPDDDNAPAFSPDGSQIAFRSERQGGGIFVMGATGESVKRLTDFGYNPSWSPDGRQIAVSTCQVTYPTDRSGVGELWAVDLVSGAKRPIWQGGDAVQPSWSPHGQRIAFWGLRGQSGQRDLWTVAADGSVARGGAVPVTDDAPLDFSPAWSYDGRYLYFSSDRGGTLNLWRIPIDEGSGRVLGESEPVTTPSGWSGWASLSRDGKALAYASLEFRSTLLRVGFDPDRGETTGSAVSVIRSTLPIRDHAVSPDGKRVAFTTAGHEDLFVVGMDGSSFRRLTDDAFRDRGPTWSPDGERLVFYSDRTGSYQLWSIRPDGSGLQQLSRLAGAANFPVWSPDGSRIATVDLRGQGWRVLDSERGSVVREFTKPVREGVRFWPLSWSSDGASILGSVWVGSSGATQGLAVCSLADGHYEEIYKSRAQFFLWPIWLRDGRRVVFRHKTGISLLDSRSGQVRSLVAVAGYTIGESLGISKDNHWITYTETATEGDIWLMRLDSGDRAAAR